jgi:hypothetical protein
MMHYHFSIRRLLTAIALLAIALAVWVEFRRLGNLAEQYRQRATYFSGEEQSEGEAIARANLSMERSKAEGDPSAESKWLDQQAAMVKHYQYYSLMSAKYRAAATRPWLSIEPDPIPPDDARLPPDLLLVESIRLVAECTGIRIPPRSLLLLRTHRTEWPNRNGTEIKQEAAGRRTGTLTIFKVDRRFLAELLTKNHAEAPTTWKHGPVPDEVLAQHVFHARFFDQNTMSPFMGDHFSQGPHLYWAIGNGCSRAPNSPGSHTIEPGWAITATDLIILAPNEGVICFAESVTERSDD